MPSMELQARGWRAEAILFGLVVLVALGTLTATTWMGIIVGDLAWRLGATCRAADVAEGAAASIATAGICAGMVLLGRWSRRAAPDVISSDPAEEL